MSSASPFEETGGSIEQEQPAVDRGESFPSRKELPGPILLVAPEPFYEDRGTPIAIKEVLTALSENGREVHLLTFPMGVDVELPGLEVFRVPNLFGIRRVPIGFSLRKVLLDQLLAVAMFWRLRSGRYSCIHAVEEMGFAAVVAGRVFGVPVLWDMQSDMPEQMRQVFLFRPAAMQRFLRWCERWLIRRVDAVVCSSGLQNQVLAARPEVRIQEWRFPTQFLDAGVHRPMEMRDAYGIDRDATVVLYTGNFEPYQGIDLLVDAAKLVCEERPDTIFVLVGAEQPKDVPGEWQPLVDRGGIKIVERQPRQSIPDFLALANIVISPRSVDGNIPLKIFEYMAAGKPIVATDIASHRTVLSEARSVLVEVSGKGLAKGVLKVMNDPDLSARLGAAAKDYAAEHLTWLAFSREVATLHQRLVLPETVGKRV